MRRLVLSALLLPSLAWATPGSSVPAPCEGVSIGQTIDAGVWTAAGLTCDTALPQSIVILQNERTGEDDGPRHTTPTTQVPEPATVAIFGSALAAIILLRRRLSASDRP